MDGIIEAFLWSPCPVSYLLAPSYVKIGQPAVISERFNNDDDKVDGHAQNGQDDQDK